MVKFIGDVHGKFGQYKAIIKRNPDTIQVGDLGLGFRKWPHGEWTQNPPYAEMVKANAKFIRGNHDNPGVCRRNTQWIKDGHVEGDMMFVGGAFSIDKAYRTEDFDWWADEQISADEMIVIQETYLQTKPRIMVTHDCPGEIIKYIPESAKYKINSSNTSLFFNTLFELYKPEVWVFGHHHSSLDMELLGTRFVCLAELEMKDICPT